MTTVRVVLEMDDAVLTSPWFWLAYTLAGVREVWLAYDHDRELPTYRAALPALLVLALILEWGIWPWIAVRRRGHAFAAWWLRRQATRPDLSARR